MKTKEEILIKEIENISQCIKAMKKANTMLIVNPDTSKWKNQEMVKWVDKINGEFPESEQEYVVAKITLSNGNEHDVIIENFGYHYALPELSVEDGLVTIDDYHRSEFIISFHVRDVVSIHYSYKLDFIYKERPENCNIDIEPAF